MTSNIVTDEDTTVLNHALVSPGAVFLASNAAPTRTVLLAGGGSLEAYLAKVMSRIGEAVLERGGEQSCCEFAQARALVVGTLS